MDCRHIFSINQSRHDDLSSMPSSPWPMRCDERGVDNSECPSVSVLYHYPSQNRSKPSKKRNPLSCIHGAWWSFAPSVRLCCRLWLRLELHQWRAGLQPPQNETNYTLSFSISATNTAQQHILKRECALRLFISPKGSQQGTKTEGSPLRGGITKSHSDQLFAKHYRGTKTIDPNLPHC